MKKRVAFRALTIIMSAVVLLLSTGAYNVLVYAEQDNIGNSLSANSAAQSSSVSVSVQGGALETGDFSFEANGGGSAITWVGTGEQQNPYRIQSLEHLLQVNAMVNDTTGSIVGASNVGNKYFALDADIDISSLTASSFVNLTGRAYFISTDHTAPNSTSNYIHLTGVDPDDNTVTHKITGGASGWNASISGHEYFALFGYLGENSVITDLIVENINVSVSTANPREIAILAYKNDGQINNCKVNNCIVGVAAANEQADYYNVDGVPFYNGIAGIVADNGPTGRVNGCEVNGLTINLNGKDDYIGGVVAQNRGLVTATDVNGIKIAATANNCYIGGIAGLNVPTSTSLGVKSCSVNLPGSSSMTNNFVSGRRVGGIVGDNRGYLFDSSVMGSFTPSQAVSATSYNMLASVATKDDNSYFGGAAAINTGTVLQCAVSNLGVYMNVTAVSSTAYFGGITATTVSAGSVSSCVAVGTFTAPSTSNCYAGGIIAMADSTTAAGAVSDCYALFNLNNPGKDYVGAVIGWGGTASTLSGCFWSDEISGCAVSYVVPDASVEGLVSSVESHAGNLTASKRSVVIGRDFTETVTAASLSHAWAGSSASISIPAADLSVNAHGAENSLMKYSYNTTMTLPAGVGSSDMRTMPLAFNLNVFISSGAGNPDDINNPFIITSSSMAKYIRLAPYAHYKLGNDVAVDNWSKVIFTGTIDGNNKILYTGSPLFTAVIGARSGSIGAALDTGTFVTNPANDVAAYHANGYITNLNVDLTANISSAVFGSTYNATLINVALTDGNPAEDDGNVDTDDGYLAVVGKTRQASFIDAAYGYGYIYGCSTDVSTKVYTADDDQPNDVAAFIGYAVGEITVDACMVKSDLFIYSAITGSGRNTGRAVFMGNVSGNTAYMLNSCVSGVVVFSSSLSLDSTFNHAYVVFGTINGTNNGGKYKNIIWSMDAFEGGYNKPTETLLHPAGTTDLFGAAGGSNSYQTITCMLNGNASYSINLPANIAAFAGTDINDFTVTVEPDGDATDDFAVTGLSVSGNTLTVSVSAAVSAVADDSSVIRIYHAPSGMTAFVKFKAAAAGDFVKDAQGYYHITTPAELKLVSDGMHSGSQIDHYRQSAYKLDANLDMSFFDGSSPEKTIYPMGTAAKPFTGAFIGAVDVNGNPEYEISNLNISTAASGAATDVALFGAVDFSLPVALTDSSNAPVGTVASGIRNLALENATIAGNENTAVLVGSGVDTVTNDSLYGKVSIQNIIISNSTVVGGSNASGAQGSTGKFTAAVVARLENSSAEISGVTLNNVSVKTYHLNTNANVPYFSDVNFDAGGIGGVIGAVSSRVAGMTENLAVSVTDTHVSALTLAGTSGSSNIYATVDAGGIIGSMQANYAAATDASNVMLLNIGNPAFSGAAGEYDVSVTDSLIMAAGMVGGIVGVSNAKTVIKNTAVIGSTPANGVADPSALPMRILSTTNLYIGGIAGYAGTNDGNSENGSGERILPTIVYSVIADCDVVNADIRATDPIISTLSITSTQFERNVAVGGIVGAANGNPALSAPTGYNESDPCSLQNCSLSGSHVEGVIVGGIMASSIEAVITADNVIYIRGCAVSASDVTTPSYCNFAKETTSNSTTASALGVGGIIGTNRRSKASYAVSTVIEYCSVDSDTVIQNNTPYTYTYSDTLTEIECRVAVGGVIGNGFVSESAGVRLLLQYDESYASVSAPTQVEYAAVPSLAYTNKYVRVGVGGIIGMLRGHTIGTTSSTSTTGCYLPKVSVMHCIAGGVLTGTELIGGVIGSISTSYSGAGGALPTNMISDVAVSASIVSTLPDDGTYVGGSIIGFIFMYTGGAGTASNGVQRAISVAAGTDLTGAFNNIFITSFKRDTRVCAYGFLNISKTATTTNKTYTPFSNNAVAILNPTYFDVNTTDNTQIQFEDASSSDTYSPLDVAVPSFGTDVVFSAASSSWQGTNDSIAGVSGGYGDNVTVVPRNVGSIEVTLAYTHTITGANGWSRTPELVCGFKFTSGAQTSLDSINISGTTYLLVTNVFDLGIIGYDTGSSADTAEFMGYNYALTTDLELDSSIFAAGGNYAGGFAPNGTDAIPFTGTFCSLPAFTGTLTSTKGFSYTSTGEAHTISGLQLAVSADNTCGLFGTVSGAEFSNFSIDGISADATGNTCNYMGSVAAKVIASGTNTTEAPLTAANINVTNASLVGADYVGGLFGGLFTDAGNTNSTASSITDCSISGTHADGAYSNTLTATLGAAGIIVHTSQYYTNISGVSVSGAAISQAADTDSTTFDNGAAGISLAYSGSVAVSGATRNTVENCSISGEIAAGAIGRTYTSNDAASFTSAGMFGAYIGGNCFCPAGAYNTLSLSAIDIIATEITGTSGASGTTFSNFVASGGILARVDASGVIHSISDCHLDSATAVTAKWAAGGIVGGIECPKASNSYATVDYNLSVDSCSTAATLKINATSNVTQNSLYTGLGGIVGVTGRYTPINGINISNCSVSGAIITRTCGGGIFGGIWANGAGKELSSMAKHLVENCVVSAQFLREDSGVLSNTFDQQTNGVGIFVGFSLDANSATTKIFVESGYSDNNYPFHNVYFSSAVLSTAGVLQPYVRIFGQFATASSYSLNKYDALTSYCYDLNRSETFSIGTNNYITNNGDFRINYNDGGANDGRFIIDYSVLQGGAVNFNTASNFVLTTETTGMNYSYENASVAAFTAVTTAGASTGCERLNCSLTNISTSSSKLVVSNNGGTSYSIALAQGETLESTLVADLIFTYSNGLVLSAELQIKNSNSEFWFKEIGGVRTYLVFNADNLSIMGDSTSSMATANFIQCYDVYWTIDAANALISSFNSSVAGKTLADVYDNSFLENLGGYQHPNPAYNPTLDENDTGSDDEQYQTFDTFFGTSTAAQRGAVPLAAIVGTIGSEGVSYGQYGEENAATLYSYSAAFTGSYSVLSSVSNTGLTAAGEKYKIYGFDLSHRNVTAQGDDAVYAGMFPQVGSGASLSDMTFVNPKIDIVSAKTEENYVGVLAGSVAAGATISNVNVVGNSTDSFVKNIRFMNPASANTGAIAGEIDGTVSSCSVSGMDIVGASAARVINSQSYTVNVGGIAGKSSAAISGTTVENCNIYAQRAITSPNYYRSNAGGIAGAATGSVSGSSVINTTLCGVSSTVNANTTFSEYTVSPESAAADRVGGIAAYAYGNFAVSNCNLPGIDICAYDTAGGIIAEVESNSTGSEITLTGNDVGGAGSNAAQIRVVGSPTSGRYYNAAGGAVAVAGLVKSLTITDFDFNGNVGTYSSLNGRDCTAGGVIGLLSDAVSGSDADTYLDRFAISGATVQGSIEGYRKTDDIRLSGAAGGIVGKIYNNGKKQNSATKFIADSVMSAQIHLYKNADGEEDDFSNIVRNTSRSTRIGKIIGELRDTTTDNFAYSAGSGTIVISDYINNIYISSYPQDIVLFGSVHFYGQNNVLTGIYTDINKINRYAAEDSVSKTDENAMMIDTITEVDPSATPSYNTGNYMDSAVITFEEGETAATKSRYFRLAYDNATIGGKTIDFSASSAVEVDTDDATTADVAVNRYSDNIASLTETVKGENYSYYPGVLTVSNVTGDIIGNIVANYTYGLQAAVTFISIAIDGNGTESDPYKIANAKQLKVVRALRNVYYEQVANIDLAPEYNASNDKAQYADGTGFEPIGTAAAPFIGSYDGNGYVISNLYIASSADSQVGFFGYVGNGENEAKLKNLHIEIASELQISNENYEITAVSGGVTGNSYVGGLVGYAKRATIENCSAANGYVMGSTGVGGLVGYSGVCTLTSCFTSTTTCTYNTTIATGAYKCVGALLGYVGDTTTVNNAFTSGFADVCTVDGSGNAVTTGAVGGIAGFIGTGKTLTVNDSFVGATVSDYTGVVDGSVACCGLTVGAADGNVSANGVLVASPRAVTDSLTAGTKRVNAILAGDNGSTTDRTDVTYDSQLMGTLNAVPGVTALSSTPASYTISVGTGGNAASDVYTAKYADIISVPVITSEKEVSDRETYANTGLYYPVTINGAGLTFTSSVLDTSDTVAYPIGLDTDLYGNGTDKNTDLLFRTEGTATTVIRNTFSSEKAAYSPDGEIYDNGEIGYRCTMPYVIASSSVTVGTGENAKEFAVNRKIVYPVQNRVSGGTTYYPIATARQLSAMGNSAENIDGSKFAFLYTQKNIGIVLTSDINLGTSTFTPIVDYIGAFNGNDFTVSNLSVFRLNENGVGMFRTMKQGSISNLNLSVREVRGNNNVGGLVGAIINSANATSAATVTISNCHVTQAENSVGVVGTGSNVGGLVGAAMRVTNGHGITKSSSAVSVSGSDVVGGLVGYCEVPVDNSYSTGEVNGTMTSAASAVNIQPWAFNSGSPIEQNALRGPAVHGIGGLIGVFNENTSYTGFAAAELASSFSSGIVTVDDVTYASGIQHGVGGLVGVECAGADISTSFSSGNVYYCYENGETPPSCASTTIGVGGLVGIINSQINTVYSSSSIAADLGDVASATAAGIGGVAGIAYSNLSNTYSAGSTDGSTTTADPSSANYGVGGVLGINDSGTTCSNMVFDKNISVITDVVGKLVSGTNSNTYCSTTAAMTTPDTVKDYLSGGFGFVAKAYPYLTGFFNNDVSLTIRINALLSIVAVQLNPLDTCAANGEGISMALDIPVGITYSAAGAADSENAGEYIYDYNEQNALPGAATALIDKATHTLSIQRTQNESQMVNFEITVSTKDGANADALGNVYAQVASRVISRACAPMNGTETHPYLVASQEDLEHVGMTNGELSSCDSPFYSQWVTPIDSNGNPISGVVNYRLMGYITLDDGFNRTIQNLGGENYNGIGYSGISFDGNGYSIRNLKNPLTAIIDEDSEINNMTFEDVEFGDGESLLTSVAGTAEGINVFGTATGGNVSAIAGTVAQSGAVNGCVAGLNYEFSGNPQNVAGLVNTNNGTIDMCASVGNFTGTGKATSFGAIAATNTGTIRNSFTLGNITFANAESLGGFVNSNSGTIENCYTRCNIKLSDGASSANVGSFAGHNTGTLTGCYASGLLSMQTRTPLKTVLIGSPTDLGTIDDSVFDKLMSGQTYYDVYEKGARTLDIINMTGSSDATKAAYTATTPTIDAANETYLNLYYPQLNSILDTYETQVNSEGDTEETAESRMYRVLRSYSFTSSCTALVGNDNYIDNLAQSSSTPLSYDLTNTALWSKAGTSANVDLFGSVGSNKGVRIHALTSDGETIFSAKRSVTDFYGNTLAKMAQLDLFAKVNGNGDHPNFASGNGTEENPFVITQPIHVVALSFYGTGEDNNFRVGNDIDMSSAVWSSYINNFKATLDGNGKVFKNVTIPAAGNNSLFGSIDGGTISSLGIAGINVTSSGGNAGLLAASSTGATVTNCYAVGVLNANVSGTVGTNAGGLIGEADSTTINGCVVSGQINSNGTYAGGVVGLADNNTSVTNCLSTAYVDCANTACGIIGSGDDTVSVTDAVFAGQVAGTTINNISAGSTVISDAYYDKQLSSASGGTAQSSFYLTSGADIVDDMNFTTDMTRFSAADYAGYPVPASFTDTAANSADFITGVMLAAAKITLSSGVGAGTVTAFTDINAPAALNTNAAKLTASPETYLTRGSSTDYATNTAALRLGQIVDSAITYALESNTSFGTGLLRYLDLKIGKTFKVTYNFVGLDTPEDALLTVSNNTGSGLSAVTAFAVSGAHSGTLCKNMVLAPDGSGNYVTNVVTELPDGVAVTLVNAQIRNNNAPTALPDVSDSSAADGWVLTFGSSLSSADFDEILITVTVAAAPQWGIRRLTVQH